MENGNFSESSANGTVAPPQLTPAELKAQEQEASLTIQKVIVGVVLLYLCISIYISIYLVASSHQSQPPSPSRRSSSSFRKETKISQHRDGRHVHNVDITLYNSPRWRGCNNRWNASAILGIGSLGRWELSGGDCTINHIYQSLRKSSLGPSEKCLAEFKVAGYREEEYDSTLFISRCPLA